MRLDEAKYWDGEFGSHPLSRTKVPLFENVWKRQQITRRILGLDVIDKHVLEVGVGYGLTAYALQALLTGQFKYCGIELSGVATAFLTEKMGLEVVQASVSKIPMRDKLIDMVWAFDSLEHVQKEDRLAGYLELNRVMKNNSTVLLNFSMEESRHDPKYDPGWTDIDLAELIEACDMEMETKERYTIQIGQNTREYEWIVLRR